MTHMRFAEIDRSFGVYRMGAGQHDQVILMTMLIFWKMVIGDGVYDCLDDGLDDDADDY